MVVSEKTFTSQGSSLKEPFACIGLAVLLFLPVDVLYLFRGQGNDLPHVRVHDRALDDLMGVANFPFLAFSDQTSRTGDLLRGEVLRAVYAGNIAAVQDLVLFEMLPSLQGTEEVVEEGYDLFRVDLVESVFHLSIFRDGLYMEEGLQIIAVSLFLHSPLELEKGGVLEEHHGKSAHADVVHRMRCLRLLAAVRNETETLREHLSQAGRSEMFLRMHEETISR